MWGTDATQIPTVQDGKSASYIPILEQWQVTGYILLRPTDHHALSLCMTLIAIVTAYNAADVFEQIILDLLNQGCKVVLATALPWSMDPTHRCR
jgi:hypothetical protein